jgi:hypothetical protein
VAYRPALILWALPCVLIGYLGFLVASRVLGALWDEADEWNRALRRTKPIPPHFNMGNPLTEPYETDGTRFYPHWKTNGGP